MGTTAKADRRALPERQHAGVVVRPHQDEVAALWAGATTAEARQL